MIFVDSGAWFASLIPVDPDHAAASAWLAQNREPLVTTEYIVDETLTLLRVRGQKSRAASFGSNVLAGALAQLHYLTPDEFQDAWEVFRRRTLRPARAAQPTDAIPADSGVFFTTYTMLSADFGGGRPRFKQLTDWLGPDFDGPPQLCADAERNRDAVGVPACSCEIPISHARRRDSYPVCRNAGRDSREMGCEKGFSHQRRSSRPTPSPPIRTLVRESLLAPADVHDTQRGLRR